MGSKAIVTRKKWSDLPQEILESIKKRLFFAGQLTFPAVCKSWSSIGSFPPQKQIPWLIVFLENYDDKFKMTTVCKSWSSIGSFPPQKQIPWLIVFLENYDVKFKMNTWSRCKLVDPTSTKTYKIDLKAIKEKKNKIIKDFYNVSVHESKYGWLLFSSEHSKTSSLFLFSPFYKEMNNLIELPDLHYSTDICFATFTSNPLEEDCLFLIVIALQNGFVIHTCRRGDESWSSWDSYFPAVGHYVSWTRWTWMYSEGGIFYYIDDCYKMGTYDFARKKWSVIPPPPISSVPELPPLPTAETLYIVKTDGEEELFLVYAPDLKGYFIQYIYRLDLSSMIWERVKGLGDNVLFIGDGYKSVLKVSEMKMKGISPDTVYYCSGYKLKCYSTADSFQMNHGSHQDDSFDYGSMATKSCRKIFIDPPPPHHYHH